MHKIEQQLCPFCPIVGIDGQPYPVEDGSSIGGIPSCSVCAWAAEHDGIQKELVEDLQAKQEVRDDNKQRAD